MEKLNINFDGNKINGSVFEGAVIGDNNSKDNTYTNSFNKGNNNEYVGGNKNITVLNDENFKNLPDYLENVMINSESLKERECASKAKKLVISNNHQGLKTFIIDNISTFTTGTFATVAGGMLLNIVQQILKN